MNSKNLNDFKNLENMKDQSDLKDLKNLENLKALNDHTGHKDLKCLKDQELLIQTKELVQKEREVLTSILHHLLEISRRRLFSRLGYSSLFEYGVKALDYSEDQIYRRISAMRLLQNLPEIEDKIASGELSLSNLNLAQSLFKQEEKLTETPILKAKKLEVLEKHEGQSAREAKKIIISISSNPKTLIPEKVRQMTEELMEIRFTANSKLTEKIEKLKGLLAHANPGMTMAELFNLLCDLGIEKWDPCAKKVATSRKSKESKQHNKSSSTGQATQGKSMHAAISASTIREVWRKFQGRCQICNSTYALEIDHLKPRAMGGTDEASNLRLLCRNCNQRAAIEQLGMSFMSKYLEAP